MRGALPVFALVFATTCYDPFPREMRWLVGRWQWTGSCCSIAGQSDLPDSADAMVMTVHHNGDATIIRAGVDTVRTRVSIDMRRTDTLATFDYPLIYNRTQFQITRTANDRFELADFPSPCADCFSLHRFARAP